MLHQDWASGYRINGSHSGAYMPRVGSGRLRRWQRTSEVGEVNCISLSSRPGRLRVGSIALGRLVAATTTTPELGRREVSRLRRGQSDELRVGMRTSNEESAQGLVRLSSTPLVGAAPSNSVSSCVEMRDSCCLCGVRLGQRASSSSRKITTAAARPLAACCAA